MRADLPIQNSTQLPARNLATWRAVGWTSDRLPEHFATVGDNILLLEQHWANLHADRAAAS